MGRMRKERGGDAEGMWRGCGGDVKGYGGREVMLWLSLFSILSYLTFRYSNVYN